MRGTLISSTPLFRKRILKLLVGPFLVALKIGDLNILDSIISRSMEYHWQYSELLASFRLS